MTPHTAYFIEKARSIMARSKDPVHDTSHAGRVAGLAVDLSRDMVLSTEQREALLMAAWWHDAARVMTNKPSFLWMPFLDDLFSAIMLWRETIRAGYFGNAPGLAARIICCKSLGAGQIFTCVLLSKKNRILLDLLKDADALDVLCTNRVEKLFRLVEASTVYHFGYRVMIWWMLKSHHLHMKTEVARRYIEMLIKEFLVWVQEAAVLAWHIEQFGETWVRRNIDRGYALLRRFRAMNSGIA